MAEYWHPLIAESGFPAEGKLARTVQGWPVLILRTGEGFSAVNDRCTHQASTLRDGMVRRGAIVCPLHGARFETATGKCLGGSYPALRMFPVRVVDGIIEVALPDHPPKPEDLPLGR